MAKRKKVAVRRKDEPLEVLAQSIIDVAKGFKKLDESRIHRRAIVILLQNMIGPSRISRKQVEAVLDAAPELGDYYLVQEEEDDGA